MILLKAIFGFVEHQKNPTYDLVPKVTVKSSYDTAVLSSKCATTDKSLFLVVYKWSVPLFSSSVIQKLCWNDHNVNKVSIDLSFVKAFVFFQNCRITK